MQNLSTIRPIAAALIAAGGHRVRRDLSALVTAFVNPKPDQESFVEVDPARVDAVVSGAWEGLGKNISIEGDVPDADAFSITAVFQKAKGNRLTELRLSAPPMGLPGIATDRVDEILMSRGFFDGSYLQFSYRNKEPRRKQMGVMIFRLNGN